ncbi:MAG: DUF3306 domain-containing protein [Betaproteobacteria bacterium]|nr:DUF3306 domain-containing protein [Betaproteobacteria bacterium]MCC7216921.1 DUF3306 domain-containing protein [Burkholderiales bacterium]
MAAADPPPAERFSLSRWSRRKHEAARTPRQETAAAAPAAPEPAQPSPPVATAPAIAANATAPEPLPPVESLTFDSDFAPFVQPQVDDATKRAALAKLFGDPHFNVMDGLDVYVDDYTQPDPMPTGMLDKLARVYEAIADDDKSAAANEGGTAPVVAAAAPEQAPAEPATAPAPLTDERAAATAPLTPTLSPQGGSGGPEGAPS